MSNLFPLTLSAVEELYVAREMQIILDVAFDGEIDRSAFDSGLEQALARHPVLSALLEPRRWRRRRWIHTTSVRPRVSWSSFDQAEFPVEEEVIDLTVESGVRFYVQAGNGRSRMIVVFHHACCDALGALQFLADLFTAYAQHSVPGGAPPTWQKLEPERLLKRNRLSVHLPVGTTVVNFVRRTVEFGANLVLRPAASLAPPATAHVNRRLLPFPGSLTRTLDNRVLPELKRLARHKRVTVNDLFIRELFYVLRDWNRTQAPHLPMRRLSQMIPLNMRNFNHDRIPATNVLAGWCCNRHISEFEDPEKLLQSIHDEGVFLKTSRLPALVVISLELLHRVPGLINWLIKRPSSFSTAVFSNVGDPWRAVWGDWPATAEGFPIFGNIAVRDVNSASPMQFGNRASFTVWHANDLLRVAMRCNPQVFSLDDAEVLLDMLVKRIVALVEVRIEERRIQAAA